MKKMILFVIVAVMVSGMSLWSMPQTAKTEAPKVPKVSGDNPSDRVAILWTSGDPDVAKKMVFLYAYNAKKYKWFKTIRFIVWGASTKLLSEDKELQEQIKKMKEIGIELYACKWCSDSYGVSELLEKLGIEVIYYGKPLTKMIKDNWHILTF